MTWHRIRALMMRHLYLYKRSAARLMDIFYWPVLELLLWGFVSVYLDKLNLSGVNIFTVILGALFLWDIFGQSQRAVAFAFMEELWEKNLLNLFVTPLKESEFLASTAILGIVRIVMVGSVLAILSFLFYKFNIFTLGFSLIPFFINLLIFGWTLGIFAMAAILRFGSAAQVFSFGVTFLIQPFSAVFYPVTALPESIRWISYLIPSTYVFEGMRAVISTGSLPSNMLVGAIASNVVYFVLVVWLFYAMLARVKRKGLLMKLDY